MEADSQEEPLDLSTQTQFKCPTCKKTFTERRYLSQHQKKHSPPEVTCTICQPPSFFKHKGALVIHRAKVHGALPYLCGKESCEAAFATNAELQDHLKENHTKCDRCNGVFRTTAGLKLHQKKCKRSDAESLSSFQSIDSGVASDESRDSRNLETSTASSSSLSLRSNASRQQEYYVVTVVASRSRQITPDMRHVFFGLPTATVALVLAHAKGIAKVDGDILDGIFLAGQSLFKVYARPSNSEGPHGSVSPSQMQGKIPIELKNLSVTLTYSPEGVSTRLKRNELFRDLSKFSKEHQWGVLKVGDFYLALVFKNDFLYVFNPGIGDSNGIQDSPDHPVAMASLKKCHRRGWHVLVDELIDLFKTENNLNDQLEYVIMPALISNSVKV